MTDQHDHDHASATDEHDDGADPTTVAPVDATAAPTDLDDSTGDTQDPVTAPADTEQVGELAWADPRTLIVGINVRGATSLDRHFVSDIRDRGVREPITVRRRAEDLALVVRKGTRRTLAAIEAGLARVRVLIEVEPDADETDQAAQIDRIIDQLGENHHREGTTERDEVRAHQQLLDFGLSAGQIARRTHVPQARVRVTTAIAKSELAAAVLERYDLTLDQAAVIADFDDGTDSAAEAVKALTVTAQKQPDQFAHVAQRLRDQREDLALQQARVDELTAAGVAILPDLDTLAADAPRPARISGLRPTADDPSGSSLTPDAHQACPGHAAEVIVRRHWNDGATTTTDWWCLDPDGHGHTARWSDPGIGSGAGGREPGPMSEQEKADRRRVVSNNKAWDSCTSVRRTWLRAFLGRKSAPRDAGAYIAATLASGSHDVRKAMESAHPTACELLGLPEPKGYYSGVPSPLLGVLEGASAARTTMITLAILLGAAEAGTSRNSWRSPSAETRLYFARLQQWGYPLSPVEELVNNPDADRPPADPEAADETDSDSATDSDGDRDGDDDPDGDDEDPTADPVGADANDPGGEAAVLEDEPAA